MQLPHFVVNPVERGNIYVTFSWTHSATAALAFPNRKPFIQRLQTTVPRVGDFVVLEVEGQRLFYVNAPPFWCGDNVLIDVTYHGPVEFVNQAEYAAMIMGRPLPERAS